MRKWFWAACVAAGLLAAAPLAKVAWGQGGMAQAPATGGGGEATYGKEKENHPRIAKSIKELRETIKYLKDAPHDFGGHRADAVEACENAIKQLQLALEFREAKDGAKAGEQKK